MMHAKRGMRRLAIALTVLFWLAALAWMIWSYTTHYYVMDTNNPFKVYGTLQEQQALDHLARKEAALQAFGAFVWSAIAYGFFALLWAGTGWVVKGFRGPAEIKRVGQ